MHISVVKSVQTVAIDYITKCYPIRDVKVTQIVQSISKLHVRSYSLSYCAL